MMKTIALTALATILTILACSKDGITPPGQRKPDPYITIRVQNLLDTTTATGRAHWHGYLMLTGPDTNLNGVSPQGSFSLQDTRLHHSTLCVGVGADSVGQRLVSLVMLGDTTTSALTVETTARHLADQWYAGNHTLPSGWRALFFPATDAWDSQQYRDGRGRTSDDPIKWGMDLTGNGSVTFSERADTSSLCNRVL